MYVPGRQGQMVPFLVLYEDREISGPVMLVRYNLYSSAFVNGDAAQGTSSGEALIKLKDISEEKSRTIHAR